MKNNYFNKLRELDRTYDYSEAYSPKQRKFVKKISHKRSRRQLKIREDLMECHRKEVLKDYV